MSASSKKKLRKEQNTAQLTEKQRREKAEAKKLKAYTWTFSIAMILVVCVALGVVVGRFITKSGVYQKHTIAAVVGNHELNTVEMSYYFNDAINNQYSSWYNEYSTYTDYYIQYMYGLDLTQSLDEQIYNSATGETWADYFLASALEDARQCYALYDLAIADEDFVMPEDSQTELEDSKEIMVQLAKLYGYDDVDDYLVARYGYGADQESYNRYMDITALAYAYNSAYVETLVYDDLTLREYEKDIYNNFSSFSFASYYMSYSSFIECEDEDSDDHDHTDAEIEAARTALKAAAESLATASSVEELDRMISELEINAENTSASTTKTENLLYSNANTALRDWLADSARVEGDIAALPYTTTTENEDGTETEVINGYYVVVFQGCDDNTALMANVRHLLVQFEGGTEDDSGNTVYSDAEKAAAETEANELLNSWKNSENPTKESFIELIKEHSDDGSAETGGLYEDINRDSSYVDNFLNWSIDPTRKEGDVEIIETEYGYHIMYFDSYDELTYRDYLVSEDKKEHDYSDWMENILENYEATEKNMSKLNKDVVVSSGSSY